ncbi:hypothetical protein NML43_25450 [Rhodopseudomonas palustris]|nr:hypothetical protein [Rhodopseudomonas palustris]
MKKLIKEAGFKKSIRQLTERTPGPTGPGTLSGLANTIVNNHFDLGAFRGLTLDLSTAHNTINSPLFESVGHSHAISYANNLLVLASSVDQQFINLQNPKNWEAAFEELRRAKELGFYYGSPVELWPLGAREIFEGQACFCQLQYLSFASGGQLGWDEFRELGMLHGIYEKAFQLFLLQSALPWPPTIDHPVVALFLLICDIAINPGAGFPFPITHFSSFITDTDPGTRFSMLSSIVKLKHPNAATMIKDYSRSEYKTVSHLLTSELLVESPLSIASLCTDWIRQGGTFSDLVRKTESFDFDEGNIPVQVLFSHFLAFMRDKLNSPEFFCWPGAWMAGERVSSKAAILFERHQALFVDKEDDDGIFPRLHPDKDEERVQDTFNAFYAATITYDLTNQWISQPGPFSFGYDWLSQSASLEEMKNFGSDNFTNAYGVHPDDVEIIS